VSANLFGDWHVTPTPAGIREAMKLFPKYGDYQELRRHALKLAYWPSGTSGQSGQICDLDWDEICGMNAPKAYELRIDERIGGHDNLRVIFYTFERKLILPGDVLPRLWTVSVMQKKTRRFTPNDLKIFRAKVVVVRNRYYHDYI
jgi:hypothetical protein